MLINGLVFLSVLSCFPLQKIDLKADPQQTLRSILIRIVDRSVFVTPNKSVVTERWRECHSFKGTSGGKIIKISAMRHMICKTVKLEVAVYLKRL